MSSGSSPLHLSCLPPGKDVARVVPGPCRHPRAQLCMGRGRAGAVIQAGNRRGGEMRGRSKAHKPLS